MARRRRTVAGEVRAIGLDLAIRLIFAGFLLLIVLPIVLAYMTSTLPGTIAH